MRLMVSLLSASLLPLFSTGSVPVGIVFFEGFVVVTAVVVGIFDVAFSLEDVVVGDESLLLETDRLEVAGLGFFGKDSCSVAGLLVLLVPSSVLSISPCLALFFVFAGVLVVGESCFDRAEFFS